MTKLDPVPGYVLKTTTLVGAKRKVFINVCVDCQIPSPEITDIAEITTRVMKNQDWVVPIIVSPESSVTDKAGNPAQVFDCCMNSQVLLLAAQDPGIKVLLNETCIELIEDTSGYELDRNYSIPKMKSKGELQHTEFSVGDLNKRPKALEEVLSDSLARGKAPTTREPDIITQKKHQPKPVIELIDEPSPKPILRSYDREWGDSGPKPLFEVEVPGEHKVVKVDGQKLIVGSETVLLDVTINSIKPIYTLDDDTLHIFVW